MQLTVNMIYNATEEIANAGNYPKIRVFTAALNTSVTPVEELLGIVLNWAVASPQSIGGRDMSYMSAVCWLYGRMIHQALGGRPIGLMATSWFGTAIEVWMPPKALQECNTTTLVLTIILFFSLFLSFCIFYREGNVAIQPYDEPSAPFPVNHSCLFNAMIHPFTRTVIYGVIWYQGKQLNFVML
jgi:sialate O-acetylesterase